MRLPLIPLLACSFACVAVEPARTAPLETTAVAQEVGFVRYDLTLVGALTRDGKDGAVNRHDLGAAVIIRRGIAEPDAGLTAASYNKGAHRGRVVVDGGTLAITGEIGKDQWVPGDPGAAWTVALDPVVGDAITGTYRGTFRGAPVEGTVTGRVTRAGWHPGTKDARVAPDGAVTLAFGGRRSGWDRARWAVYNLSQSTDVAAFDGLRVRVATPTPRSDAWLDVAVMEDDGSWYAVRDAVPLSAGETEVLVDLDRARQAEFIFDAMGTGTGSEGNFDEDYVLDRTRIRRVAIGLCSGRPIGEVAFRMQAVEWAAWKPRTVPTAQVAVSGRTVAIDGHDTVPSGVFGFHYVDGDAKGLAELRPGSLRTCTALGFNPNAGHVRAPTPEAGVDFWVTGLFDRKQQLPQATDAKWEETVRAIGRNLGEKAKPLGSRAVVEWWNEPYLDLGRMLDGFQRLPLDNPQGVKAGDPVEFRGQKLASMIWVEGRLTKDAKGKEKITLPTAGATQWRAPEGATGDQGMPMLFAVDPSRFSYWSGRQLGIWYTDLLVALGEEAMKVAPELRLVGGFGFRWNEDDWAAWDLLYKDMIDRAMPYLHGVCEHHYQGHTDGVLGMYEVLAAYTDRTHGRRLLSYNTETNDLWDAPARGNPAATAQSGGRYTTARRLVYNLRDILGCVIVAPDKVAARAIHAKWKDDPAAPAGQPWKRVGIQEGEWHALHLLRRLRGRLVEAASSDRDVWVASALDGDALVAVVYNDAPTARTVALTLAAPQGTAFAGGTSEGYAIADGVVTADRADVAAKGGEHRLELALAPNQARAIALTLQGTPAAKPDLQRTQIFADGILAPVAPAARVALPIALPADAAQARRAWFRLAVERVGEGEGWVEVGGERLPIPVALTPAGSTAVVEIPVDPRRLAGLREIAVGCAGPGVASGFLLASGSVVLERGAP